MFHSNHHVRYLCTKMYTVVSRVVVELDILVIPQEGIAFAGLEHPSSRIPPTITTTSPAAAGSTSRGLVMPASTMTPPLQQPPLRHVVVVGLPNTATA